MIEPTELGRAMAAMVNRRGGSETAQRALQLASDAVQAGHICAPWDETASAPPWLGGPQAATLAIVEHGSVYLRRYQQLEQQLADGLLAMAGAAAETVIAAPTVAAAFAVAATAASDQATAVARAMANRLTIITGGPGTGKTYAVGKLVELILQHKPNADIVLAAPTGKAATRLAEVASSTPAMTLHRLLQLRPDQPQPGFTREHPLPHDWVIVDEASMVDLPMMSRLLQAIGSDARLVLVGDPHQLHPVEAGSAFAEICAVAARRSNALHACLAPLQQTRRFSAAISRLAQAINAADKSAITAAFSADDTLQLEQRGTDAAISLAVSRFRHLAEGHSVDDLLVALSTFRLLTALRQGPQGVDRINQRIDERLRLIHQIPRHVPYYHGLPVMVTRNDRGVDLTNGDVGVCANNGDELQVAFGNPGGEVRWLPLAQLPEHELCYATTIHKAQGSEFADIAILLPDEPHPLLTRELIYTAITRARQQITVFDPAHLLDRAAQQTVRRFSGLKQRLD